jgi:hypothetical protein
VLLSAIVSNTPWDHSLGSRTGGSQSLLELPPNRIPGSGDSEFVISAQIWCKNLNMTLSLFVCREWRRQGN